MDERGALKALREIPGVGPSIARDLLDLGYSSPEELRDADPEAMYRELMRLAGKHVDRCVLYVFRCAVHYARTPAHERDPERLKWWSWKDRDRS